MTTKTEHVTMDTTGGVQIIDITGEVRKLLTKSDLQEGLATVFVPGSTATVTTIEYEPGLVADMTKALDRIAPRNVAMNTTRDGTMETDILISGHRF